MIDPLNGRDEIADLYLENGILRDPNAPGANSGPLRILDATGLVVVPGLIDLHVHFRDPGNPTAENAESGSAAAARGGIASVVLMPNTRPPVDTPELMRRILEQCRACGRVEAMSSACITRNRAGTELADLQALAEAGAVAFTDDGSTVADESLMRQAMRIAAKLGLPILDHALDPHLAGDGVMHQGKVSVRLGLPGIPSEAENLVVARDIRLSEETGCRVHIQHISTAESVDLVRKARENKIPVSAEATPHHLWLTEDDIDGRNADFKMNPPVRSVRDRNAILEGVVDGSIHILATDHAPHSAADKAKGFLHAPFGIVGLETAIGITYTSLVLTGRMSLREWVRRWTEGPATVLGMPPPRIIPGQPAHLTVLDLTHAWQVDSRRFLSRSRNTPFEGLSLKGRAIYTFSRGSLSWAAPDMEQSGSGTKIGNR